jgi:hypothetical protein
MTLRKTAKPGEYFDDGTGSTYVIYDVYPKVITVAVGPEGYLLQPAKGEEYILVGFACPSPPAGEEGNLVVEVNGLNAWDMPVRVLRDVHARLQHAPLRAAGEVIRLAVDKLSQQYTADGSDLPLLEEAAQGVATALKKATDWWVAYVEEVKGPGIKQLLTSDHECMLLHRGGTAPIQIDVYMHVRRACST